MTKWATEIDQAERIPEIISRAFHVATSGRPGPVMRHHTDLVPLKRVEPRFPEAARSLARNEERCTVRVEVNEAGQPARVTPRTCPVLFQRAAIEAAEQWRWVPYLVDGQPVSAAFDLQFVFRLHD